MKTITTLVLFVIALSCASAQTTVLYRTDTKAGTTVSTYAVMTPQVEVWAFGPETQYSDIEVGKLVQVASPKGTFLMAGGYLAVWPHQSQVFMIPYLLGKAHIGSVKLAGTLGAYVPLNGGPTIVFSDEASAMLNLDSKVQVGAATSFWSQGGSTTHRFGPKVSATIDRTTTLSVRYLQGNAPANLRFCLTKAF